MKGSLRNIDACLARLRIILKIAIGSFVLSLSPVLAEQELVFRSHDPIQGFFYEIRTDADYNRFLYVYKDRTGSLGRPVFETGVNIFSAFHSPDGKFLVVNIGSGAYGNVPIVLSQESEGVKPFMTENDYRSLIEKSLIELYPTLRGGTLLHLYAPIRDIRDGEALVYAGGDFYIENSKQSRQQAFHGVFLAIDLHKRTVRRLDTQEGLRSWYRGLPDLNAAYGSGVFVGPLNILTSAHVVESAKRVVVGLGNREAWADVVARSDSLDLALLALRPNSLEGIPIVLSPDPVKLGEKVRAFGYPLPQIQGYTLKETEGVVSGLFGLMDDPLEFQCTAPIQPGNSGGPLVDDQGRLVGVAVSVLNKLTVAKETGSIPENVNFATHLDVVRQFVKDNRVELTAADSQQVFDPERSCVQIIVLETANSAVRQTATPRGRQTPTENDLAPTSRELDEAEVELNRVYRSVRQWLPAAGKERLKALELQWLAIRDKVKDNPALYLKMTKDQIQVLKTLLLKSRNN
jgi:hypothetical protein